RCAFSVGVFHHGAAALRAQLQPRLDRHAPAGPIWFGGAFLFILDGAQSGEPAMAMTSQKRSGFGQLLQFLLRFLGLNGLVAAAVGAFLWYGLDFKIVGLIVGIAGICAVGF